MVELRLPLNLSVRSTVQILTDVENVIKISQIIQSRLHRYPKRQFLEFLPSQSTHSQKEYPGSSACIWEIDAWDIYNIYGSGLVFSG